MEQIIRCRGGCGCTIRYFGKGKITYYCSGFCGKCGAIKIPIGRP
jgi:hypothetical protein